LEVTVWMIKATRMKANGMLGMIAAVKELFGGRYFWMTSVTTPIANAAAIAPASDVSRATTTAAKAAAISVVIPDADNVLVGATRMPARPASVALTAQTPTDTRFGLVPDSEVIASESTMARTRRPTSVKRSTAVPASRMKIRNP
jgi:hypothetical protein